MKKVLRFTLLSLMALFCGTAVAQTTFDFDADGLSMFGFTAASSNSSHDGDFTEEKTYTEPNNVITIKVSPSGATTANRIWGSAPALRMYGGTLTITATKNIIGIDFTHGPNWNIESTTPATENVEKWRGSSTTVEYKIKKNTQINKMIVYVEGDALPGDPEPVTIAEVANIAAFKAIEENSEAKLTLAGAEVLYVNNKDVFVRDASGAVDFYNLGFTFEAGQKLNGTITAKYSPYNGLPELVKTDNTKETDFTKTDGSEPVATTVELAAIDNTTLCNLVKVTGVTVELRQNGNYTNAYAKVGDKEIMCYDKFQKNFVGNFQAGKTYDVEGIVVMQNNEPAIALTKFFGDESAAVETTIAELVGKTDKVAGNLNLKLTAANILKVDGKNAYVREGENAILIYGFGTGIFADNDVVSGTIIGGAFELYNGMPEYKFISDTDADNLNYGTKVEATPVESTFDNVKAKKNLCDLVKLTGVTVVNEEGKYYMTSGEDKIQVYDKFSVAAFPETVDGMTFEIVGLVALYKDAPQIIATKAVVGTTGINAVMADADVNAPAYNLAGQRVDANYKGIVVKNGKKFVNK